MEKPKTLSHLSNAGNLTFFQRGINSGKGVVRSTSDSITAKRMMSAKGSITADHESLIKIAIESEKAKLPKPGCGAKEIERRLKRIQKVA